MGLDKIVGFLSEWVFHYLKNRDLIVNKIDKIEEHMNKSYIFVKFKDKNQVFFIEPEVESLDETLKNIETAKKETGSEWASLVVLNSISNLKAIQESWGKINKDQKFSVLFINPFSTLDKKWMIFPHTHSRITEPESLKQGLKALFETVEQTSVNGINSRIKQ